MKSTPVTLTEITLLNEQTECLHLEERIKNTFDYPLHKHKEMELNFVIGGTGLKRVVGDSIETSDYFDLALIGSGLEHQWAEPNGFEHHEMHEITIQFSTAIISDAMLANQAFSTIRKMLADGQRGVCFSQETIRLVKEDLYRMAKMGPGFERYILLLRILHTLSGDNGRRTLASEEFSHSAISSDSQRIRLAMEYIHKHFKEEIRLEDLAKLVCMSTTSFSRFFSLRTHKSVSEYIIDHRLGYAARLLVDTRLSVIEICYDSGFNNVSNFNRLFKKRKGYTPTEYRNAYYQGKMHKKNPEALNLIPVTGK